MSVAFAFALSVAFAMSLALPLSVAFAMSPKALGRVDLLLRGSDPGRHQRERQR
jgi:hypothetical protein